MRTLITINEEDLIAHGLSKKEIQLLINSWDDYQLDYEVSANPTNPCYKMMKDHIVSILCNILHAELRFQKELYHDFSLDKTDDYFTVAKSFSKELHRNLGTH